MVLPLTESAAVTTALEAMASGVPVMTTEGGVRDYIEDKGGALFRPGDADAMAESVLSVLRDEESLQRMKIRAREQALQFSWPTIAVRTAEVYSAVMSR
jgi:L-malate glycosyltransferase